MDEPEHECQVCSRFAEPKLSFYCHRCARNTLYESRISLASTLLAKETLGKEIEVEVKASGAATSSRRNINSITTDAVRHLDHDQARSEYRRIAARTQAILDDSRQLQEEMETMRVKLAETKADNAKRNRALKGAIQEIRYEEETSVKASEEKVNAIRPAWDRLHTRTVEGRHVLPKELASLYGLQIKQRRKSSGVKESFSIAGVPIFNLKELNSTHPEHLNASTYHVAHLTHLASHYLGVRLPAEISLATAGQPYTYVHSPMSSYKASTLVLGVRDPPNIKSVRRRVLWLDKPLPQLASDDNEAYSLYLDAIILLSWNVAWLAKTQGIDVGSDKWEDICLVGKNLWTMFGEHATGDLDITSRNLDASSANGPSSGGALSAGPNSSSQASAHSFLVAGDLNNASMSLKNWKYSSPTRIIDTIKSALVNERMGADWEVLEKPEEEEAAEEENGRLVGQQPSVGT